MIEMKDLAPMVLTLVFIGFIIAVGVIIQSKTYTAFADTANFNESVSCVNNTQIALATNWVKSVTFVGNGSDDLITGSTNYSLSTLDEYLVYITCLDEGPCADAVCYGTGTYDVEGTFKDVANSEASSATSSVLSATKDIATSWLGLIITVIILSLVLGLVMGAFGERR